MATLFKYNKNGKLYLVNDGPLGKFTGHYKQARPYNHPGESMILDFKPSSAKFKDFHPVATVNHRLGSN